MTALGDLVGFDAASYAILDASAELRAFHASSSVPDQVRAEYLSTWRSRDRHLDPAHPRQHLHDAGRDYLRLTDIVPRLRHTAYYDRMLRPAGLDFGVRIVLRDGGRAIGTMSLARQRHSSDFRDADMQRLRAAIPHMVHALVGRDKRKMTADTDSSGASFSSESALLIVDRTGRVRHLSAGSWSIVNGAFELIYPANSPHDSALERGRPVLSSLTRHAERSLTGIPGSPAAMTIRNRCGTFRLRAYALVDGTSDHPGLFGIQIERRVTLAQKLYAAPAFRNLTPREREVCFLLTCGHTHREVANDLNIGASTAIFHIRNIYSHFDVRQRADLLPALLGEERGRWKGRPLA